MITWFLDHAPTIGLTGFFVAFIFIALWAYAPRNKSKLQAHAQIPFKE